VSRVQRRIPKALTSVFLAGIIIITNNTSVALVRERTISTEQPPLVGEVSANYRVVSVTDLGLLDRNHHHHAFLIQAMFHVGP
jgi:hypothetical protein